MRHFIIRDVTYVTNAAVLIRQQLTSLLLCAHQADVNLQLL